MSLFQSHWLILVKLNSSPEPETGNYHMVKDSHGKGGGAEETEGGAFHHHMSNE